MVSKFCFWVMSYIVVMHDSFKSYSILFFQQLYTTSVNPSLQKQKNLE